MLSHTIVNTVLEYLDQDKLAIIIYKLYPEINKLQWSTVREEDDIIYSIRCI